MNYKKYLITESNEIVYVTDKQQLDLILNYAEDTNISVPNSLRNIKIFPVYVDLTPPVASVTNKSKDSMSYKKFLNQMTRIY